MEKKLSKNFLFLRYLHLKWLLQIVSITKAILVTASQCVKKQF